MGAGDYRSLIGIASELEDAGLVWLPEVGDEVSSREEPVTVSILVDPQGLRPQELRGIYLWLPTLEQVVFQLEQRQAILFHAGLEISEIRMGYNAVIQSSRGSIEARGPSLRIAVSTGLRELLIRQRGAIH